MPSEVTKLNEPEEVEQSFSVIKFFELFKRELSKVNQGPIRITNCKVQTNAYARLADDDAEDPHGLPQPFAVIAYDTPGSDSELAFALELYRDGFVIAIQYLGGEPFQYLDLYSTEKEAAEQLVRLLTMLASGQLAMLTTTQGNRMCFSELLFYGSDSKVPDVILCVPIDSSDLPPRDGDEYDYQLHQNTLAKRKFKERRVGLIAFLADPIAYQLVRECQASVLSPMTHAQYRVLLKQQSQLDGGNGGAWSSGWYVLKQWDFLLILASLGAAVISAGANHWLPQIAYAHPVLVIIPVGLIASLIYGGLSVVKEDLARINPGHWYIRLDRWMHTHLLQAVGLIASFGMIASCFVPDIVNKSGAVVSIHQISADVRWAALLPFIFGISALLWLRPAQGPDEKTELRISRSVVLGLGTIMWLVIAMGPSPENVYAPLWADAVTLPSVVLALGATVVDLFRSGRAIKRVFFG